MCNKTIIKISDKIPFKNMDSIHNIMMLVINKVIQMEGGKNTQNLKMVEEQIQAHLKYVV